MDQSLDAGALTRRVGPGGTFGPWEMADPVETLSPGAPRPMPDRVTYCFKNGWVDTGDLPCREAFLASLPGRAVEKPEGPFPYIHWDDGSGDVDYSTFRHRPTHVSRGFRCRLRAVAPGPVTLRISTCGGVNLWLGDGHVAAFEPFRRNRPCSAEFALDIPPGQHDLTLLLEDLHERDTTCFFSLTHVAGAELEVSLDTGADPAAVAAAARLLNGIRPDRVFATSGQVRLVADAAPDAPVTLRVTGPVPFGRGGLTQDPDAPPPVRDIRLGPDTPAADLFPVAAAPAGCLSIGVAVEAGRVRLTRQLGVTNLPPGTPLDGDLAARKERAAGIIAEAGGFDPSVAALLALRGRSPDLVARIVAATLVTIEERYDCSDFSILPLLRLWRDARDQLRDDLRERMKRAFLGYRYWYDAPGNDVMWFWSENHVLCFHAAQLVAGRLFPDLTFTAHGMTGDGMAAAAALRLERWFDAIDRDGLCEWNSAAYYPIDLLGLLTLHDMAPELRDRAGRVMDRLFTMAALHTTGGVPAGTQGRAYEKELLAGPVTELGSVAAIAFGGDFWPGHDRAASLLCLSDYAPPSGLDRLATPKAGGVISARYTQGHGHAGKLTLWKTSDAQLSSVTGLEIGGRGHQAHLVDVQFAAHPMARLWINHPGELKVWGERRPSLLAGNHVMPAIAQHGSLALMIYDLDREWTDLRMTQLFAAPDAFDRIGPVGDWRVFRSGDGAAAVWCSRPLEAVPGLYAGALHRAHGDRTAWVVALARPGEDIVRRLGRMRVAFDAEALALTVRDGEQTVGLDYSGMLTVDGTGTPFAPLSSVPHVSIDGGPLRQYGAAR